MKTKILFLIAVLGWAAAITLFMVFNPANKNTGHQNNTETISRINLKEFVEIAKKDNITRTEIYHLPFAIDTYVPLSEEDLVHGPHLKISCEHSFSSYPSYIADAFDTYTVRKNEKVPSNFRYCCLMYSESKGSIRFSIAYSLNTICINGESYEVPFEIIDTFLKLLPVKDYEAAIQQLQPIDKKS